MSDDTTQPDIDTDTTLAQIDDILAAQRSFETTGTRSRGIRLVAEGDSWFDFIHADVIDWLRKDHGYDIESVAKAGACVFEMAYGLHPNGFFEFGDKVPEIAKVVEKIQSHRPQALLLSGGGNDFVGPEFILTILHREAAGNGMNKRVMDAIVEDEIEPAFRRMIDTYLAAGRRAGLGTLPIFMHGYDHVFPDGRHAINLIVRKIGPWMDPSFGLKGWDYKNAADLARRRAIVAKMIDTLYRMLDRLASSYPSLRIVNIRGLLKTQNDWHDELHPTRDGFRLVANKFAEAIKKELGGTRSGPPAPLSPDPVVIETLSNVPLDRLTELLDKRQAIAEVRVLLPANDGPDLLDALENLQAQAAESPGATRSAPDAADLAATSDLALLEAEIDGFLHWYAAEDEVGTRAAFTYETRQPHYKKLFASCKIRTDKAGDITWYRSRILKGQPRYEALANELSLPWAFIAIIHALECSCDFGKHLHNGDPLTRRTVRVPAGRPAAGSPPFTFEASARDALTMPGKQFHLQKDWSVPAMLFRWERYNGIGYFNKGLETPYLWSFSNHYTKGKYVQDGVFDLNAVSKQVGAAVLLKDLIDKGHYQPTT